MSPLDASFLHIEDGGTPMHIGSVGIFEGPAPSYEDVRDLLSSRMDMVPRYRQKVRFVPLGIGRPVWVDDPHFHIDYHLRHTALPAPGSHEQLRNTVSRLMAQQLDRSKPLWEMWIMEGVEGGRWALVSKVHHCMVDGVSGSDLLAVLLEATPEPEAVPPTEEWRGEPEPSSGSLMGDAIENFVRSPYEQYRALRSLGRGPHPLRQVLSDFRDGMARMSDIIRPHTWQSLNGSIGPHRQWDWATVPLGDVKTVAKTFGGKVNDVVLATITSGLRDMLLENGEEVGPDSVVMTLVPVSVRTEGERNQFNNKVAAMFASLPVGVEDPVERLRMLSEEMTELKGSKEATASVVLSELTGFAPPNVLATALRFSSRIPQRYVNTVTTNIPGPQFPLYMRGRLMLHTYPYVPLTAGIRVETAIFSYDGKVDFGITADYESVENLDVLCRGIENGLAELCKEID